LVLYEVGERSPQSSREKCLEKPESKKLPHKISYFVYHRQVITGLLRANAVRPSYSVAAGERNLMIKVKINSDTTQIKKLKKYYAGMV
jgi:hypothetical protein